MKKSIKDLGDIKGKVALVRVDVNVPLDENKNVKGLKYFSKIVDAIIRRDPLKVQYHEFEEKEKNTTYIRFICESITTVGMFLLMSKVKTEFSTCLLTG